MTPPLPRAPSDTRRVCRVHVCVQVPVSFPPCTPQWPQHTGRPARPRDWPGPRQSAPSAPRTQGGGRGWPGHHGHMAFPWPCLSRASKWGLSPQRPQTHASSGAAAHTSQHLGPVRPECRAREHRPTPAPRPRHTQDGADARLSPCVWSARAGPMGHHGLVTR